MPNQTFDSLITAIKSKANEYARADAADRTRVPAELFNRFSANFSELLSENNIDNTIELLKKCNGLTANHTQLLAAIRDYIDTHSHANETLKTWKINMNKLVSVMPVNTTITTPFFKASPLATTESHPSSMSSSHRQPRPDKK